MNSDDSMPDTDENLQAGNPDLIPEAAAVPPATGSSGRCLLYGCSVVFITGLFLILCAGFGTYYYFTKQIQNFTSETPEILPSQAYDEKEMVELETRVQEFEQTLQTIEVYDNNTSTEDAAREDLEDAVASSEVEQAKESDPEPLPKQKTNTKQLSLSAADLNALIARHPKLKNKLVVKIEDGIIAGDLSLPLDEYLPGGKGRFFNGSGTFDVSLEDGTLVVRLIDAMVGEQPIPPAVMSGIRKQNLASEFQKDPKASRAIRKFDRIEVRS